MMKATNRRAPLMPGSGEGTQAAHRAIRLFGCLDDDLAHGDAPIRGRLDLVQEKPIGDRVDEIEDVVEAARERIDVLAVDGRDKRGIEPPHHLVGDRVARVLEVSDLLNLGRGVWIVESQLLQDPGC